MNYEEIKKDYETTKISFKKLALKYGTHYKALERKAKKENWIKFKLKEPIIKIETSEPVSILETPKHKPNTLTIERTAKAKTDIKELLKKHHQPIDDILIMTYIDSYQSFIELKEELENEGKFIMGSKGNMYMNPKYSALQMEKMNLIKIGKELGLTIQTRLKLHLDLELETKHQESSMFVKVDKLLNQEEKTKAIVIYRKSEKINPILLGDFECKIKEVDTYIEVHFKIDGALSNREQEGYELMDMRTGLNNIQKLRNRIVI